MDSEAIFEGMSYSDPLPPIGQYRFIARKNKIEPPTVQTKPPAVLINCYRLAPIDSLQDPFSTQMST
jgi:hypothetical protein